MPTVSIPSHASTIWYDRPASPRDSNALSRNAVDSVASSAASAAATGGADSRTRRIGNDVASLCRLALADDLVGVPAAEALFTVWCEGLPADCKTVGHIAHELFRAYYGMGDHAPGRHLPDQQAPSAHAQAPAHTPASSLASDAVRPAGQLPGYLLYIVRSAAQAVDDLAVMRAIDSIFLDAPAQKLRAIVDDNTRTDSISGAKCLDKFWDRSRFIQTEEINAFGKQLDQRHVRVMTCINIDYASEKEQIARLAAADARPMLVPVLSGSHWRLVVLDQRGTRGILYDSRLEPENTLGFSRNRKVDPLVARWFDQAIFRRHIHAQFQGLGQVPNGCGLFVCDMMEKIVQGYPSRGGQLPLAVVMMTGLEDQRMSADKLPLEFNRHMRLRLIEPFLGAQADDHAAAVMLQVDDIRHNLAHLRTAAARRRATSLSGHRQD